MKNNDINVFEAIKYKCPIPLPGINTGDILFCQSPTTIWLCMVEYIEEEKVYYYANYNLTAGLLNKNDWFLADYINRRATDEEKELLLKILDNEDGKEED